MNRWGHKSPVGRLVAQTAQSTGSSPANLLMLRLLLMLTKRPQMLPHLYLQFNIITCRHVNALAQILHSPDWRYSTTTRNGSRGWDAVLLR